MEIMLSQYFPLSLKGNKSIYMYIYFFFSAGANVLHFDFKKVNYFFTILFIFLWILYRWFLNTYNNIEIEFLGVEMKQQNIIEE